MALDWNSVLYKPSKAARVSSRQGTKSMVAPSDPLIGRLQAEANAAASVPAGTPVGGNLIGTGAGAVTGYDGGGGGGISRGGGTGGAASSVAPPRLTDDQWLDEDSQYNSAVAALEQKLRDFEVENTSTREKGTQDYDNSLLRLGWIKPTEKGGAGSWNQEDRSTSYGNAYQGQMSDFASRGLLQSTLYDQARNDMLGNFNRQRADMDTAQTNFLEELARALSAQKSDTQLGRDQARVQALARRAAAEDGVTA